MTKTYLNILTKEEFAKRAILPNTANRFVLDENSGEFNHLGIMFNEHVKRTDKILVGGDCVLSISDLKTLLELIEIEESKLTKIFLDSWEFQVHPKTIFLNYDEVSNDDDFDRTKAYLAEKAMENINYEIRKGQFRNYKFEVKKHWYTISKQQIQEYLHELKTIVTEALSKDLILTSTYY